MPNSLKRNLLFILPAAVAASIAYSGAFEAYFWSDDFHTLALARYIEHPFALFGNHYPFGALYRPLGLFYWWLVYQLFGLNVFAQHLADFLIYLATAVLLWRIASILIGHPIISGLLACLVLVHPTTASTAMWYSTRFDMLAAFFILLAVYNGIRHAETGRYSYVFYALLAQTLAILSKEPGYITPMLLTLILLTFPHQARSLRAKLATCSLFILSAVILLGVRYAVIGGLGGGFSGSLGDLPAVLWQGYLKWLYYLPQYLFYNSGLGLWGRAANLALWMMVALLALYVIFSGPRTWLRQERHILVLGSALLLSPGLTIAVVSGTYPFPTLSSHFSPEIMMTSRYYYLSLIGLALLMSHLASASLRKSPPVIGGYGPVVLGALMCSQIALFTATSHEVSAHWSSLTNGPNRRLIEAVSRAVSALKIKPGCKIYILNTESEVPYLTHYMDVAIKSVSRGEVDLAACLIQGERPPYYYLASAAIAKGEVWTPLAMKLKPSFVGNMAFLYLAIPEGSGALDQVFGDDRAVFLWLQEGVVQPCPLGNKTALEAAPPQRDLADLCGYRAKAEPKPRVPRRSLSVYP